MARLWNAEPCLSQGKSFTTACKHATPLRRQPGLHIAASGAIALVPCWCTEGAVWLQGLPQAQWKADPLWTLCASTSATRHAPS